MNVLQHLVKKGVDLNSVTSKKRKTALQLAVFLDFTECVKTLVENGADINIPVNALLLDTETNYTYTFLICVTRILTVTLRYLTPS